jgi:hypothetical protein
LLHCNTLEPRIVGDYAGMRKIEVIAVDAGMPPRWFV